MVVFDQRVGRALRYVVQQVRSLGETLEDEYRLTTSPDSGKQVEMFVWSQRRRDAVAALLDDNLVLADDTVVPFAP